jgi:hypothetical protein
MSIETAISEKIAGLPTMSRPQLLQLWRENFDKEPPPGLHKPLIVPLLAYRIQENTFGGLSLSSRIQLREIAAAEPIDKAVGRYGDSALQAGTKLIRSWKGDLHQVIVTDNGFEYLGRVYQHLSPIAFAITGTQRSGQVFFGLKKSA